MAFKRGALIVLEGLDKSGKSTQSRLLVENLTKLNIPAQLISFPDRSTITGELINEYLKNQECKINDQAIHLMFSANRWEKANNMIKLLYEGITLVVDRYSYSGIAYSASKGHLDIEWCKKPEIGLPKPDVVFLFKLNEQVLRSRLGFGGERYENISTQKKVSEIYESLKDSSWEMVDASDTIENINKLLMHKVLEVRKDVKTNDLKELQLRDLSPTLNLN